MTFFLNIYMYFLDGISQPQSDLQKESVLCFLSVRQETEPQRKEMDQRSNSWLVAEIRLVSISPDFHFSAAAVMSVSQSLAEIKSSQNRFM